MKFNKDKMRTIYIAYKDLTKEEIHVYEIIMQSGSNGINVVDIKSKIKINNTSHVNRILAKLSKVKDVRNYIREI